MFSLLVGLVSFYLHFSLVHLAVFNERTKHSTSDRLPTRRTGRNLKECVVLYIEKPSKCKNNNVYIIIITIKLQLIALPGKEKKEKKNERRSCLPSSVKKEQNARKKLKRAKMNKDEANNSQKTVQ